MCPKHTYFNPTKSYCTEDNSFCAIINAKDQIGSHIKKPLIAVPTPRTDTTTTETAYVTVPGTHGICSSCNGLPKGTLVPVIGVCEKYCVCGTYTSSSDIVVQTCPSKLFFNPTQKVCDWPLASGCTPNTYSREVKEQPKHHREPRHHNQQQPEIEINDIRLLDFIYRAMNGIRQF